MRRKKRVEFSTKTSHTWNGLAQWIGRNVILAYRPQHGKMGRSLSDERYAVRSKTER